MEENFAENILLLDLKGISDFTDCFVLATASSARLLDSLSATVKDDIKAAHSYNPIIEGSGQTGWIILDYGYVVVHLLSEELRDYYNLEDLWGAGKVILSVR